MNLLYTERVPSTQADYFTRKTVAKGWGRVTQASIWKNRQQTFPAGNTPGLLRINIEGAKRRLATW